MTRVYVLDKSHKLLDEIVPDLGGVSWRLNNIGRVKLSMSYADPKCTPDNLQYGNFVLVEFDNGLQDWIGVIDTPSKQTEDKVSITAYSAEQLLTHRVTDKYVEIISGSSGGAFKILINRANARRPMGIDVGSIYYGGIGRKYKYSFNLLWKEIKKLSEEGGRDFDVTPLYSDGLLQLFANWYDIKGKDKTQVVTFAEGENVESIQLDVQGKIANQIFMIGTGQTWGDERLVSVASDATSQADYGYREYAEIQSSVEDSGTLLKNADQALLDKKDPVRRFKLTLKDSEPGEFGSYELGDRVRLHAFLKNRLWSFDGTVRIIAMEYKDKSMRVEVEEYV